MRVDPAVVRAARQRDQQHPRDEVDRRAAVHRRARDVEDRDRVRAAELLGRREPAPSRRRRCAHGARRRTASCGGATTRTTRARTPSPRSTCARCSPTRRPTSSSRSSPATPRRSTTSTSTRSRREAERVGPDGRGDRRAAHRAPRERQPGTPPRAQLSPPTPSPFGVREPPSAARTPKRRGDQPLGAGARGCRRTRRGSCAFHASVMPHGYAPKPCGMSGATKSSTSLPAAAQRDASISVSSSRWSARADAHQRGREIARGRRTPVRSRAPAARRRSCPGR